MGALMRSGFHLRLANRSPMIQRIRAGAERLAVFVFMFAFASDSASASENSSVMEYPSIVRSHGAEAGVSQINALLEGQDGYLWLGTFGGLVRFDGAKFTTFHAARARPNRLDSISQEGPSSDRIVALRQDNRGRLWIGSQDGGLSLYERGRFRQHPLCRGTCRVYALSPQSGNTIWAATNVGLFRIAMDSLRATVIRNSTLGEYGEIAVAKNGHLYVGGSGKSMAMVVGQEIVPVELPDGASETWELSSVGKFLWVLTDKGFYRFDPSTKEWLAKTVEPGVWPIESPDGSLWLSTPSGKLLRTGVSGELQAVGDLPPMRVLAVWRDRSGVLWLGGGEGLWSLQTSKVMLRNFYADSLGLAGESGRAVVGDGAGGVWEGYFCAGIRHRLKDGTYKAVTTPIVKPPDCIGSLLLDNEGALWAGMLGAGLRRVADEAIETIPRSSAYADLQIWQARNGDYWLAAERHTFRVRRKNTGKFVISSPIAALEGLTVRKMVDARKGGVWLAGDHGLLRLDGERIVERWTPEEGLSSRFVRAVYEDHRGVLWVGTYGGGLNRIENGKLTHYDESNGLFDDTVSCILADEAGQMWLGGNRGISVLPISSQLGANFETLPFAVSSASVSIELNGGTQSACYRDSKGHLWFALVRGFAEIDPSRLIDISPLQPQVHIEQVVSQGKKYDPMEVVSLSTRNRSLEITYSATNLLNPEQLSFRYRMSAIGAEWIDAGSTRSVIFQNSPWGDHVFEVQARNLGGSWSPSATIRVSRPAPWYQRRWLWPLLSLAVLLTMVWCIRDSDTASKHQLDRITARSTDH